jgi:hypothetical protein
MTFILRWPAILVLLALVLLRFAGALGAAGVIADFQAPASGVSQVDGQVVQAQAAAAQTAASASWIDVGLLAGAGLFFLIAAVRLMRRTQGFWVWLLGFALFGGRWAWQQQQSGGLVATVQGIDVNAYTQPQAVIADIGSPESQIALLAIILIVGLFVFIVDAADRAYWDKQGA